MNDPTDEIRHILDDARGDKLTRVAAVLGFGVEQAISTKSEALPIVAPHWLVPGEKFCLSCRKSGHFTNECWSTSGLNTAADRELGRLCYVAHDHTTATARISELEAEVERLRADMSEAMYMASIARLEKEMERLRADAPPVGVVVSGYRIGDALDGIRIERAGQMFGPDKWAVRRNGSCLNKAGEWEWEPMPSGREDDFLERCRFDTAHAAIDQARQAFSDFVVSKSTGKDCSVPVECFTSCIRVINTLKASVPPDQETPKGV